MAQVANCPQCEHELLVPDGTVAGSWSRCPNCRAFFQLKDAKPRELSALEVVDPGPAADDNQTAQTVADFSSMATWPGDSEDDSEAGVADVAGELEHANLHIADETADAEPIGNDELETAELHIADDEEAETLALEPTAEESPEAAAQRIDAWFRSAKTLPDVPPLEDESSLEQTAVDYRKDHEIEPASSAANNATIDMSSQDMDALDLSDDFELEKPSEAPQDIATWDDPQHMDRLLAGLQDQPHDEFVSSGDDVDQGGAEEDAQPAGEWQPDESLSIVSQAGQPRRKKSIVRTMLMTVLGGVMAVPLAGYALLWLKGPEADFLGVAKYLPQAMLPASFKTTPRELAGGPPTRSKVEETPSEPVAETPGKTADEPAEKQASFTEPVNAKKADAPTDDRSGDAATTAENPAAEPAAFDAPPATPVKENAAQGEAVHIANAPTFTTADLNAALQSAKDAESGLVNGSMSDSREVARTKGLSYSVLADLAQKVMFVDASSSPGDAIKLQQESDEVFRKTLSTAHTREEVAQIVPMWIASPNRRHGGVFFAGSVVSHEGKGTVSECSIDLGGGKSLPVLVPAAVGERLKGSSSPVVVVGWIVDKPAENVTGYSGNAPQAVFASKLIPLE